MANRQLVDYILSLQHTHFTQHQIKSTLLEVGWSERDVASAFDQAQKEAVIPVQTDLRPHLAIATCAILLFLALVPFLPALSSPTGNVAGSTTQQVHVLAQASPSTDVLVLEEIEQPAVIESAPAQKMLPAPQETPLAAPAPVNCEMQHGEARDACFAAEAEAKLDHRICSRIRDHSLLTNCVTQIAIAKQQPQLCDPLIHQDACRTAYVRATKDQTACELISEPQKRAACTTA